MLKPPAKPPTADAQFVANYLATRGLKDSGENRGIVARLLKTFPGPRPASSETLLRYVDRHLLR